MSSNHRSHKKSFTPTNSTEKDNSSSLELRSSFRLLNQLEDPFYNSVRDENDSLDSSDVPVEVFMDKTIVNYFLKCLGKSPSKLDDRTSSSFSFPEEFKQLLNECLSIEIIYYDGTQPMVYTEDFPHRKPYDSIQYRIGTIIIDTDKNISETRSTTKNKNLLGGGRTATTTIPENDGGIIIKLWIQRKFPLSSAHGGTSFRLAFILQVPKPVLDSESMKGSSTTSKGQSSSIVVPKPPKETTFSGKGSVGVSTNLSTSSSMSPLTTSLPLPPVQLHEILYIFSSPFKVLSKQGKYGTHGKIVNFTVYEPVDTRRQFQLKSLSAATALLRPQLEAFDQRKEEIHHLAIPVTEIPIPTDTQQLISPTRSTSGSTVPVPKGTTTTSSTNKSKGPPRTKITLEEVAYHVVEDYVSKHIPATDIITTDQGFSIPSLKDTVSKSSMATMPHLYHHRMESMNPQANSTIPSTVTTTTMTTRAKGGGPSSMEPVNTVLPAFPIQTTKSVISTIEPIILSTPTSISGSKKKRNRTSRTSSIDEDTAAMVVEKEKEGEELRESGMLTTVSSTTVKPNICISTGTEKLGSRSEEAKENQQHEIVVPKGMMTITVPSNNHHMDEPTNNEAVFAKRLRNHTTNSSSSSSSSFHVPACESLAETALRLRSNPSLRPSIIFPKESVSNNGNSGYNLRSYTDNLNHSSMLLSTNSPVASKPTGVSSTTAGTTMFDSTILPDPLPSTLVFSPPLTTASYTIGFHPYEESSPNLSATNSFTSTIMVNPSSYENTTVNSKPISGNTITSAIPTVDLSVNSLLNGMGSSNSNGSFAYNPLMSTSSTFTVPDDNQNGDNPNISLLLPINLTASSSTSSSNYPMIMVPMMDSSSLDLTMTPPGGSAYHNSNNNDNNNNDHPMSMINYRYPSYGTKPTTDPLEISSSVTNNNNHHHRPMGLSKSSIPSNATIIRGDGDYENVIGK